MTVSLACPNTSVCPTGGIGLRLGLLPAEFGKWSTVYQRFRRWSRAGVFDRIFDSTGGDLDVRSAQVDGSYVKVHQHGTGAPKGDARPTTPDATRPSGGPAAGSRRSSWRSSTGGDGSCASPS